MQKKDTGNGGVAYARKEAYEWEGTQYEADIKNEDTITIKNEGAVEDGGQYGEQFYLNIETRNGEKKLKINQTSINILIDAFGEESQQWVDKEVTVYTKKDIINNKKVVIVYLAPSGYILDEWGELVKEEPNVPREAPEEEEKSDAQKEVEEIRATDAEASPF